MSGLLNLERLRGFAASPEPVVFARMALLWADEVPVHAAAIRAAGSAELPDALHQLRSGAVAVGLPQLAAVLAGIEQRAEAGRPPAARELDTALGLAERSATALREWWATEGHPGA